jgi:hypothetical protein
MFDLFEKVAILAYYVHACYILRRLSHLDIFDFFGVK